MVVMPQVLPLSFRFKVTSSHLMCVFVLLINTQMVQGHEVAVDVVEGEGECGFVGQEEDSRSRGHKVAEKRDHGKDLCQDSDVWKLQAIKALQ